jgi:7-carboxy-7-deazaguanine synthase
MRVAEIFHSIQGEGPAMGRPATFVRLAGCNLRCGGCDTSHDTWWEVSPESILGEIAGERAVITGGEPTLQMEDLSRLIDLLHKEGKEVHMETNGTNSLNDEDINKMLYVVVSPKCGSVVDFSRWSSYENVHFKFVLGPESWCWTAKDLEELLPELPRRRVWIMPFGTDPKLKFAVDAWDLAIKLSVNYSDRLHIRLGKR